jgi:hypothetical protein
MQTKSILKQALVSLRPSGDRVVLLAALATSSAAAGSALGAKLLLDPKRHARVNPLVAAAVKPVEVRPDMSKVAVGVSQDSLETQVALNGQAIEQILRQNQVSIDDRAQIHSTIDALASTEVNHYNQLNDRLNVDDARVMTIG